MFAENLRRTTEDRHDSGIVRQDESRENFRQRNQPAPFVARQERDRVRARADDGLALHHFALEQTGYLLVQPSEKVVGQLEVERRDAMLTTGIETLKPHF